MAYSKFIIFSITLLLVSCSSEERSLEKIKESEAALYGDGKNFNFDETRARETIDAYKNFVKAHPKSEHAPEMLLKAADLHRALKEFDEALQIFQQIEKEYPAYPKIAHVIFLQGFVYENELGQMEKAKERYETFLQKYPDHELANDVRFSLRNLGKTPEQIIREFEQNQNAAPPDTGAI